MKHYEALWYYEDGNYDTAEFSTEQALLNFYKKHKNDTDKSGWWLTKRNNDWEVIEDIFATDSKRLRKDSDVSVSEIATFINNYAEVLWANDLTDTYVFNINANLCIAVGWLKGFDPEDATNPRIKGLVDKDGYGICAKIGIRNSDWDYEYIDMPITEDGEVMDVEYSLTQFDLKENCKTIAKALFDDYQYIKDFDFNKQGQIIIEE